MVKDVIKVSLLQKRQNDRIKNIVSVFYGIQCSLNNLELSVTIMTNSSPNHNTSSFLQQRNFDHVFHHDNARYHLARVCQDFLNQNHIRVLPWPALSPDLSPIELLLDELGRRVRHRQNPPETLQWLRDALVHEWNNIPSAFIQRLIGSMRRRCEAVVAARDGHTRY
jgi:transposase